LSVGDRVVDSDAVLAGLIPLEPLSLPLLDALGCVVARAVIAPENAPAFATVAADGFAITSAEHSPGQTLRIVDDVPAGFRASEACVPGTCIRVARGAPLPDATDTVVETDRARNVDGGVILEGTIAGSGVTQAGGIIRMGAMLATAGTLIDAEIIGLLARAGIRSVDVHPRPRVLVVTVGTECVEPGVPTPIGLVSDHLSLLAAALVSEFGATAFRIPPLLDDLDEIGQVVDDHAHRSDVIVLCGVDPEGTTEIARALALRVAAIEHGQAVVLGVHDGTVVTSLPDDPAALSQAARGLLPAVIDRLMGRVRA
jgi:molybdopterin molybdotransferase